MRRFIRYLYEYENGQRVRNVGFVKVEWKEEATSVTIHGKGLRLEPGETLKLYIFYMDEENCRGIWQENIQNVKPALNYRLIFTKEHTGRPENYSQIAGVILAVNEENRFAAVWDDMEVDIRKMIMWDEETVVEEIDTYITPTKMELQKIDRRDIARLPRCEWRLANNSFLVHGYQNYHHLVLLEEEEEIWLGVPGIFHEKEAKAAEMFGFPRFLKMEEDWPLEEDERNKTEIFGYWLRKIQRGMIGREE